MSRGGVFGGSAVAMLVACCAGGVLLYAGGQQTLDFDPAATTCTAGADPAPAKPTAGFDAQQVQNATTIVRAGQQAGVPARGWVIAVATAMQESTLYNRANTRVPASMALPHQGAGHDHDSVGLFQQRPSPPDGQGSWGPVADLMDPAKAARKFYTALKAVPGWEQLPLTVAAQRVQRSAYPNAYAKHEPRAAQLVNAVTGGAASSGTGVDGCAEPGQVTAGGWTAPAKGAKVGSPFGPRDGRLHAGVDLMIPKRTAIVAVADGTVLKARCDASTEQAWGCNRDGSPDVPGCGWYVDIQHADGVGTRYCHMVVKPLVVAGQHVAAGQQIGWSGSSGHSSGPHLHFETHTGGNMSAAGATDPVRFMRANGVVLGST